MKKKLRYLTYILAGIAMFTAILFTNDKFFAEAANRVYLNETDLVLELGHYRTLKVRGSNQKAIFKSANNNAATVSSGGRVTAKGWGSTTIYTYVGNKTLKTKVTIVQMNKKNVGLSPGQTSQLTLWGATSNDVEWKSSNKKVATVSDKGLVTAVSNGNATITATFKDKKIVSNITVIGLNHDSFVLEHDPKFSLTGSGFGHVKKLKVTGTNDKVTWSSSNTNVATVNSKGKVTAKGPGSAKITASVKGTKISADVKVLKISYNQLELNKGENFTLEVLGTKSNPTWKSYNTSIATVTADGIVTAKSAGTTKIVAEVDGKILRCILTVR